MLEEMPIVIGIPKQAVRLTITTEVYLDEEIRKAEAHFSLTDIQDLRKDFERFIGDDWNALYCLTEEARMELARHDRIMAAKEGA